MTHTPLPWKHSRKSVYVSDMNHNCLVQMLRGQDENEANAAFIVKAVNSHEALVKLIQRFSDSWVIERSGWNYTELDFALKEARTLLTRVGGSRE